MSKVSSSTVHKTHYTSASLEWGLAEYFKREGIELEEQLRRTERERDILKKALAIFSQPT